MVKNSIILPAKY